MKKSSLQPIRPSSKLGSSADLRHSTRPPRNTAKLVSSGPQHCAMMANFTADMFAALSIEKAKANGGSLSVHDIEAVCTALKTTPPDLWSDYRKHFSTCVEAAIADKNIAIEARTPLRRLITSTFAHRFTDSPKYQPGSSALPRKLGSGFFSVLPRLIGDENIDQMSKQCSEIISSLQREYGIDFSWSHFFHHDESLEILDELRAMVAEKLDDFDKRTEWMIGILSHEIQVQVSTRHVEILLDSFFQRWIEHSDPAVGSARNLIAVLNNKDSA